MSETILSVTSSTKNNNSKSKKDDCVTVSLDKRSQQQVLHEDIGNLISPFEDLCFLNEDLEDDNTSVNDGSSENSEEYLQLTHDAEDDSCSAHSNMFSSLIVNDIGSNQSSSITSISQHANNDQTNVDHVIQSPMQGVLNSSNREQSVLPTSGKKSKKKSCEENFV